MPTPEEKEDLRQQRTVMGNQPGNLEAWLLVRSCRTLGVRIQQQCNTAAKLASWLEAHPCVQHVSHPSLESHPDHGVCMNLLLQGGGRMMRTAVVVACYHVLMMHAETFFLVSPY